MLAALLKGVQPTLEDQAADMYRGFNAPFKGLDDAAYNGARRFPLSIPLDSADLGNAAAQTLHYRVLLELQKPAHFIWGCADDVFTEAWGRQWAQRMGASFVGIEGAGHFLQNSHGPQVCDLLLKAIAAEAQASGQL